MQTSLGMILVIIGIVLVISGLAAMIGLLDWFGRLPGDIRFERGGTRVYIPVTSMIIVSIVLTLIVQIVMQFFR